MARPVLNNCSYYRHKITMRNHRKVKALRNKFGQVLGYAFWSMFLEYLTEADGNELEYSDIEIELFSAELGVSATEIRGMIDFCIGMEMLFCKNGFISSESLDEELHPVYEKRKTAKKISATQQRRNGKFYKNTETHVVSATEIPLLHDITTTEMPSIREEKRREDNNSLILFDEFRKMYKGSKRGNKTEFNNFKKHEDWKEVLPTLKPILENQILYRAQKVEKKEWIPEWKNLKTWVNNRCWEDEYSAKEKMKEQEKHTDYVVTADEFYGRGKS